MSDCGDAAKSDAVTPAKRYEDLLREEGRREGFEEGRRVGLGDAIQSRDEAVHEQLLPTYERGRAEERADVVAWAFRNMPYTNPEISEFAYEIKRGAHVGAAKREGG